MLNALCRHATAHVFITERDLMADANYLKMEHKKIDRASFKEYNMSEKHKERLNNKNG